MNIFLQSHSTGNTGSDFSMREIIIYLSSKGHNIFLCIPPNTDKEYIISLSLPKKNIIYLKPTIWHRTYIKGVWNYFYNILYRLYKTKGGVFYTVPRLLFFLLKNNIELMHSNSLVLIDSAIAAKLLNISHIQHVREEIHGERQSFSFFLQSYPKFFRSLMNFLHAKIICNSEFVYYNSLQFFPENKLDVLTNSFSDTMYNLNYEESNKIKTIGMVANVTSNWKNHMAFLEIAKSSKKNNFNLKFNIYGKLPEKNNEYYKTLLDFIKQNNLSNVVDFKGYCHNEDLFKRVDVFVHTNDQETFGRTFVEAMIFKTPIIALESNASKSFINHGENGFIISKMDPKLFIEAIKLLIENPNIYSTVINNAFKTSLKYKTSIINQKLDKIYKSIL